MLNPRRYGIKAMPWHANMTEMKNLGKGLMIKPEVIKPHMDQLFTSVIYSDNPLTRSLMANAQTLDNYEYEYAVMGPDRRPLIIIEDVMAASDIRRGSGTQKIKLKGDHKDFVPGDVLAPNGIKKYQCRVQDEVVPHGNGYLYSLRPSEDNIKKYIPTKFFKPGVKWVKLYSVYAEAESQSGSTQYATSFNLKGRMSRLRKKYKVTGDVVDQTLAINLPTKDGGYTTSWIRYAESIYWKQWYKEWETLFWYSKHTNSVKNADGRPVFQGSGVQEQLEESTREQFSVLSATFFEEFLMDVLYAKTSPGQTKIIEGYTGTVGLLNFNRVMTDLMSKRGWVMTNNSYNPVQSVSSEFHSNAYSVGAQIVEYRMSNNIILRMKHNPIYDDKMINPDINPLTGYPTEAERYTFLSVTGSNGDNNNIRLVKKRGAFRNQYIMGLATPWGANTGNHAASHPGDFYEFHAQDVQGVKIEDPTACGELLPSRIMGY